MADENVMYIGSDKVVSVADIAQKTPLGNEMVEVTFENNKKVKFTKKAYELIVTDIASDLSIVRRTKFNAMVPAIIAVICEYDLKVSEIQALLQEVAGSIDNSFSRATNYAWTKDDQQYVPNTNPMFDRSLLEADVVIKSIPEVVEAQKPAENGAAA
jgi:hypothetical protein